jgi:hypothetical protein
MSQGRFLPTVLGAFTGALAMYLLDPEQGRRRRAMLRERARRTEHRLSQRWQAWTRDLRGELSKMRAELPARRESYQEPIS